MDKNNHLEQTDIASQERTYEVVVDDLNSLFDKWNNENLRSDSAINTLLFIAIDQYFSQLDDPELAVRMVLYQLGRAVEVNSDDEELKGMFQRTYLHEGDIH